MEAFFTADALLRQHVSQLRQRSKRRVEEIRPQSHVESLAPKRLLVSRPPTGSEPSEAASKSAFLGDWRMDTIRKMLARIDDRGFERSPNQVKFHEAFLCASGRCIYKEEWEIHRREILRRNGWDSDCAQIIVSTPRRFGKTFR